MHVLLVENNPVQAILVGRLLSNALGVAIRLEQASRLKDALDQLASRPFDVVILDLHLPDCDGLVTLVEIAAGYPAIPIIVLTDQEDEELALEALRRGAQDYFLKSELHGTALVRSLRHALERTRCKLAEQLVLESHEQERKRLSRELHDGVIQSLSSMRLQLQILAEQLQARDPTRSACLQQLADAALATIDEVRRVSNDLHPVILERRNLGDALMHFGKKIQKETGVVIKVFDRFNGEVSPRAKLHLFRIFQEALRNAIAHARTPNVRVEFGARGDQLILEIRDSGDGFDLATVVNTSRGLGLRSIRERAQILGGRLHIESHKNHGTLLRVEVPAGRDFRPMHYGDDAPADDSAPSIARETVSFTNLDTVSGDQILENKDADPSHLGR